MDFENTAEMTMLGARVLIKPDSTANQLAEKGLVAPDGFRGKMDSEAEIGEVILVGPAVDERDAVVGDIVMITKHNGYNRKFGDGINYRIVMDEDILARAKREGE